MSQNNTVTVEIVHSWFPVFRGLLFLLCWNTDLYNKLLNCHAFKGLRPQKCGSAEQWINVAVIGLNILKNPDKNKQISDIEG